MLTTDIPYMRSGSIGVCKLALRRTVTNVIIIGRPGDQVKGETRLGIGGALIH